MSKRKPNNPRKRIEAASRAILRANHVAVINIDPSHDQGLINWKTAKQIAPGRSIAEAICDVPHRWSFYFAAMCADQSGGQYMKSTEATPNGLYLSSHLADVIEAVYKDLLNTCNPRHVIASGWIAFPYHAEISEEQAWAAFEGFGAFNQSREAA